MSRKNPGLLCGSFCKGYFHGQCIDIVGVRLDSLRIYGVSRTCVDCRNRPKQYFDKLPKTADESLGDLSSGTFQEIRAELKQIREQSALLESVAAEFRTGCSSE